MELRLVVAYALIALLVLSGGALVAWLRYNSRDRNVARQRRRERESRYRRRAEWDEN